MLWILMGKISIYYMNLWIINFVNMFKIIIMLTIIKELKLKMKELKEKI